MITKKLRAAAGQRFAAVPLGLDLPREPGWYLPGTFGCERPSLTQGPGVLGEPPPMP